MFEKVDYLLLTEQPACVFTDHRNPLFVFPPLATEPGLGRHVVSKVQLRALFLSRFDYMIEHMEGEKNVFTDILTCRTKGYGNNNALATSRVCSLLTTAEQVVAFPDDIEWAGLQVMHAFQAKAANKPSNLRYGAEGLLLLQGRIWIPVSDVGRKLKVLIVLHCGAMGHRGKDATKSVIRESLLWQGLSADVTSFVQECLQCIATRTGEVVPRPYRHSLHGARPKEALHVDVLSMGASSTQMSYVLIIGTTCRHTCGCTPL